MPSQPSNEQPNPNNLNFLYQRHRSRLQGFDSLNLRPVPSPSHESGKRDPNGVDNRLHRIYPSQLARNKPNKLRSGASPQAVTSPLLTALGSTTNTAAQYTNDWARSLPFFTASQQTANSGTPPSLGRDASDPTMIPSASPPGRPQSHPNQYPNFGGRQRTTTPQRDRRSSVYSQFGQSPYSGHVPLPHQDQAHFYPGGLPDLDSVVPNLMPSGGLSPGERGYFVGFDTLSTSAHGPSTAAENVLLIGEEGTLRIYRVTKQLADPNTGSLEGLRGSVIGAKILPWPFQDDPGSEGRPYVAIILHKPVPVEEEAVDSTDSNTSEALSGEENDSSPDPSTARAMAGTHGSAPHIIRYYQTTVEIYSLSKRTKVATVFESPLVETEFGPMGELKIPPPVGDLRIDANGKFLVVASGTSGEVFIFSSFTRDPQVKGLDSIRCIGKLWTSLQRRGPKPSASASTPGDVPSEAEETEVRHVPLFSLSHRWIAIVPPPADSLFSMKGTAHLLSNDAKPPGIRNHVAPPKPTVNCGVDTPDGDGIMNRVGREVTQRVLKSAQWMGQQGMQAWNTYWTQPQVGHPSASNTSTRHAQDIPQQHFPPTHGHSQTPSASPTQVAIFDLQRLLDAEETKIKNALHPIACFEPPNGCSYLSFAPSGLVLLTVSRKGDEQYVWSLMRMQHPRSSITYDNHSQPYVRQITKVTRMTVATIVDCVWNSPYGNRFALLTERGTIHVHEIPSTAFQWPPLRRARKQKPPPNSEYKENDDPSFQKAAMSTAMDTINGTGAWLRSVSMRSRSLGNNAAFPTALMMAPAATANAGGKVVKAGLNKGVSMVANSANTIYHASENKLHIGNLTNGISPGCMYWLSGRDRGYFAVVVTGHLSIYHVRQTTTPQKGKPPIIRAKISKKATDCGLHKISDAQFPPAFTAAMELRFTGESKSGSPKLTGHWNLRAPVAPTTLAPPSMPKRIPHRRQENWHAMYELDSIPGYQPLHHDRRISLLAYHDPSPSAPHAPGTSASADDYDEYLRDLHEWTTDIRDPWLRSSHHVLTSPDDDAASEPWVFGDDIPANVLIEGGGVADEESGDEVENRIRVIEGADGEQVVVTTVRRRGREEEEFFEDGCEVLDFAGDER
ncbi:hypothetical protein BT63DRAFT_453709 [Microthyrium microscopicum]|uniref:BCAS3 domain-containing protein n=1 Tax=Microthyrium microscopicum TaxID=703497 RepID=A0A6A6UG99_9PEZI|nr:hypothetical protein BT63DRAFT_453709 [Microthyrium microscopicum]